MNKIEEKHLEILKGNLSCDFYHRVNNKEHAACKCAEITKEYAMEFDLWKAKKTWSWVNREQMYGCYYLNNDEFLTFKELWDLFINDLNEKV